MNYQKIDLTAWDRGELFAFYIRNMRIVMSLTVDVDVAPLAAFVRQNGLKFYPAMIWTVSRVINAHDEFKYGWDADGSLIRWDFVSPSYAHFHPEDQAFTKMVTPYADDLAVFHAQFLRDRARCQELRAIVPHPISRRIFSTCPVCHGSATGILICMCSTRASFWPRWSPGAGLKKRRAESC